MDEIIKALRKHPGYRPPSSEPSPATESTLREVWRLWNLLPDDWAPDTKIGLLGCSEKNFPGLHAFHRGQRQRGKELRRKGIEPVSAKFLKAWTQPLGENYRPALNLAEWWHNFARHNYPILRTHKSALIKRWLAFLDDDLPRSDDDVATWRTGQELIALKTFKGVSIAEFWKLPEPALVLVLHAQKRWQAYRDARKAARQHFSRLDVAAKLADYATPADALWRVDNGFWQGNEARKLADRLSDAEKEMARDPATLLKFVCENLKTSQNLERTLRRTHRTTQAFLDNIHFMVCCAYGFVSQDELLLCLPTFFPKLTLDEKIKFLKLTHARPRQLKKNRLLLLRTWLQDNAPLFSEFHWHTEAVLDAAAQQFNDHDKVWIPESGCLLTQFCTRSKPKIKLGLRRSRYRDEAAGLAQQNNNLLTKPPLAL
jgi:hypothetical protein